MVALFASIYDIFVAINFEVPLRGIRNYYEMIKGYFASTKKGIGETFLVSVALLTRLTEARFFLSYRKPMQSNMLMNVSLSYV